MKQTQQIAQLKSQLSQLLDAYNILEEYCCELVDNVEENETLTYANSIVTIALNSDIAKTDAITLQDINTVQDVQKFFEHIVYDLGISMHVDTPFSDYYFKDTDKPCFTKKEALRYQVMMERCDFICDLEKVDIYKIGLNVLQSFIKI
jgi:hypothetical protein